MNHICSTMSFYILLTFCATIQAYNLRLDNTACTKFSAYPFKSFSKQCYHNPNVMATTAQMLEANNYKCETHYTTTEDYYILALHRIVDQQGTPNKGRPVLFLHGLLSDSGNWVGVGNRSLPFVLFELGYDPWLGNLRGNQYSRNHTKLKDSDFDFWDFSGDTIASNDVPALVEKVVNETGKKILYVGHSVGVTTFLGYTTEYPDKIQRWVDAAYLMTPGVYLVTPWFYSLIYKFVEWFSKFLLNLKVSCLFYEARAIAQGTQELCTYVPYVCLVAGHYVLGPMDRLLPEDFLTMFSLNSITISAKLLLQTTQFHASKKFQKLDFGIKGNLEIYGEEVPPVYNLGNIKHLDVTLFYSDGDRLFAKESVERPFRELGTHSKSIQFVPANEPEAKFNHADYLYADCLPKCLNLVPKMLKKYPPDL